MNQLPARAAAIALTACWACGQSTVAPPPASGPAPAWVDGFEATFFARALDVSCAPSEAKPGVEGCLALFRYQGSLTGVDVPGGAAPYGSVLFVRTDAAGKALAGWPKALLAGYDPISMQSGGLMDDDLRVHLLASGEFLVSGTYEGRLFVGTPGGNNQELGPAQGRNPFLVEFHADGTFDNWEDTGNGRELHALGAVEVPSGDLVLAGSCLGDVPLDQGTFPCGETARGFLLTVHHDCSTVGAATFGGAHPAEARDLAADALGNLYVSGTFEEEMKFGSEPADLATGAQDAFVMKVKPDGTRAWIVTASSLGEDRGGRLARVDGGLLWTARVSPGARVGPLLFHEGGQVVALLDDAGQVSWAHLVPEASGARPLGVAAGSGGSFALYGEDFLGRYSADGKPAWLRTGAEVRGAAFVQGNLVVATNVVGTSVFGVPLATEGPDALRAALVAFPR